MVMSGDHKNGPWIVSKLQLLFQSLIPGNSSLFALDFTRNLFMLPLVKGIFLKSCNQCTNNSGILLWTKIAVSAAIAFKNSVKKQHSVSSQRPNLSSLSAGFTYLKSEYVLNEGLMPKKYLSASINLKLGDFSFITSLPHSPFCYCIKLKKISEFETWILSAEDHWTERDILKLAGMPVQTVYAFLQQNGVTVYHCSHTYF